MTRLRESICSFFLFLALPAVAVEIATVEPPTVDVTGGASVTVEGTGFESTHSVRIGGKALVDPVFADLGRTERITGKAPALPAGSHNVDLVDDRTGAVLARKINAITAVVTGPTIDRIEPEEVAPAGGTPIVLHGSSFVEDMEVLVDGVPFPIQRVLDPRRIGAVTPPLTEGPHTVALRRAGAILVSKPINFKGLVAPDVDCTANQSAWIRLHPEPTIPNQVPAKETGDTQESLLVPAGQLGQATSHARIVSSFTPLSFGLQGWALSLEVTGDLLPVLATTTGTVSEQAQGVGFVGASVIDPSLNNGKKGFVAGVVLSFTEVSAQTTLSPQGTATVLNLQVTTDHALSAGEVVQGGLRCTNGLKVSPNSPITNSVTYFSTFIPACECYSTALTFTGVNSPQVTIAGVEPGEVDTDGGTPLEIRGSGFTDDLEVLVGDEPLRFPQLIDSGTLRGFSPPLGRGMQTITIRRGGAPVATLRDGVTANPLVPLYECGASEDGVRLVLTGEPIQPNLVPELVTPGGPITRNVPAGNQGAVDAYMVLASDLPARGGGVRAWTFSLRLTGGLVPVAATFDGSVAADTAAGGLEEGGFTAVGLGNSGDGCGDTPSVVGVAILSNTQSVTLPPQGSAAALKLTVQSDHSLSEGEVLQGEIACHDGLRGRNVTNDFCMNTAFDNGYWLAGSSTMNPFCNCEPLKIQLTGTGTTFQLPADGNLDGVLDLSDATFILGHLFLGRPERLRCGDGTVNDPANLRLLDANGDARLDLSDATSVLGYLFLGTRPPVLGRDPVSMPGCPAGG